MRVSLRPLLVGVMMMRPSDLIEGCNAASLWLKDECKVKRHPQTIRTAVLSGDLTALNADEMGLRGKRYLFNKQDLLNWYLESLGVER